MPSIARYSDVIVYVDESGDYGMQTLDPKYPVFVLAFCAFDKRHYCEKVIPALQKFKFSFAGCAVVRIVWEFNCHLTSSLPQNK